MPFFQIASEWSMLFFYFFRHFSQFLAERTDCCIVELILKLRGIRVTITNINMPILVQLRGSLKLLVTTLSWHMWFSSFSAFSASFKLKWLIFEPILMFWGIRNSIFNRNVPILVKTRGLAIAGDKACAIYVIFLLFS